VTVVGTAFGSISSKAARKKSSTSWRAASVFAWITPQNFLGGMTGRGHQQDSEAVQSRVLGYSIRASTRSSVRRQLFLGASGGRRSSNAAGHSSTGGKWALIPRVVTIWFSIAHSRFAGTNHPPTRGSRPVASSSLPCCTLCSSARTSAHAARSACPLGRIRRLPGSLLFAGR